MHRLKFNTQIKKSNACLCNVGCNYNTAQCFFFFLLYSLLGKLHSRNMLVDFDRKDHVWNLKRGAWLKDPRASRTGGKALREIGGRWESGHVGNVSSDRLLRNKPSKRVIRPGKIQKCSAFTSYWEQQNMKPVEGKTPYLAPTIHTFTFPP